MTTSAADIHDDLTSVYLRHWKMLRTALKRRVGSHDPRQRQSLDGSLRLIFKHRTRRLEHEIREHFKCIGAVSPLPFLVIVTAPWANVDNWKTQSVIRTRVGIDSRWGVVGHETSLRRILPSTEETHVGDTGEHMSVPDRGVVSVFDHRYDRTDSTMKVVASLPLLFEMNKWIVQASETDDDGRSFNIRFFHHGGDD